MPTHAMDVMTESGVVAYLLREGLIDARCVVDGDLRVVDESRRNVNFRVVREGGASYLLKGGTDRDPFASTGREASVYALLAADPRLAALLPQLIGFDAPLRLLILEYLTEAEDLRSYHRRTGRFPAALAADVGRALAHVHAFAAGRPEVAAVPAPAGLFLHRPGLRILHDFSSAGADVVRLIQRLPELAERLDGLRRAWRADAFIHADARWDNVLVVRSRRRAGRVRLLDWEAAGLGDRAWDLGCFLGDYAGFWINSIPLSGGTDPGRYLDVARYPIARMQPALRACWAAYVRTAGLSDEHAAGLRTRATAYAGVRLLETALEHVQRAPELDATAVTLLQAGANLVMQPDEGARVVLGIVA